MFNGISHSLRGGFAMILLFLCLGLSLMTPKFARGSVLGDAAAKLSPGQFTTIIPISLSNTFHQPIGSYADKMAWDPVGHKILYLADNGHCVAPDFVIYDVATNSWTAAPLMPAPTRFTGYKSGCTGTPWPVSSVGHAYGFNTTDSNGNFYYKIDDDRGQQIYGSASNQSIWGPLEFKYNIATGVWSELPYNTPQRNLNTNHCCEGWDYFPEAGGIIYPSSTGQIWRFNTTSQTWDSSAFAIVNGYGGGTWSFAKYNPVLHVLYFGTDSAAGKHLYKLASNGTVTQLSDPPSGAVFYDGGVNGNFTVDPVSGDMLLFTSHSDPPWDPALWIYHPATDAWTVGPTLPTISPSLDPINNVYNHYGFIQSTAIPEYGVIATMFCGIVGDNGSPAKNCAARILLYKHAPGSGTPPPPPTSAPTLTLSANPNSITSGTASALSWSSANASSCTASGGWSGTKATSGSASTGNLTASATYTLTCTGTGGSINRSTTVTIASSTPPPSSDADFQARCSAPGVVKCWGFDNPATDLVLNTHVFAGSATTPSQDTTIKASGTGSLKFTIPPPPNGGANSAGKWEPINGQGFGGTTFGPGSTFYTQFRMRIDDGMLTSAWSSSWKFFELLYNASIYGNLGLVWVNKSMSGAISGYEGATNIIIGKEGVGGCVGGNVPAGCGSVPVPPYSIQQFSDGRTCDYPEWYTPGHPDCLFFRANVWQTFQFKVTYGTNGAYNSRIEGWYMKEGDSSFTKFLDTGPNFYIGGLTGTVFNTANFSTYMTSLDPNSGTAGVTSHMWIDEFIISTQEIAQPGAPTPSGSQPPVPPTGLVLQ